MVLTSTTQAVPYSYPFWDPADLIVVKTDQDTLADTPLSLTTHYTISGGNGASGTVTLVDGAAAIGDTLTVYRQIPYTQTTDLEEGDPLPSAALEQRLDRLTVQIQQVKSLVDRALRLGETSPEIAPGDIKLPASKFLGFNADSALTAYTAEQMLTQIALSNEVYVTGYWMDDAARATTEPDFVGQLGVQLDTGALYRATGLTAGSWAEYDMLLASTANNVANSNLTQASAHTLKGNPTGATANLSDFKISALAEEASPGASDLLLAEAADGTLRKVDVTALPGGQIPLVDYMRLWLEVAVAQNLASLQSPYGAAITFEDATPIDAGASSNYYLDSVNAQVGNYPGTVGKTDLLGHYDLDETSGTRADSHTSSKDLSLGVGGRDPGYGTGIDGNAMNHVGDDRYYLKENTDTYWDAEDDFSVSVWVRPSTTTADTGSGDPFTGTDTVGRRIVGVATATDGAQYNWDLAVNATGHVMFSWWPSAGVQTNGRKVSTTVLLKETWYHIAAIIRDDELELWINGVQETVTQQDTALSVGTSASERLVVRAGSRAGDVTTGCFLGRMDELAIWERALSASEILALADGDTYADYTASPGFTAENMTLITAAMSASLIPSDIAVVCQFDQPDDDVALNTDFTLELSRDDGTTWSTATLSQVEKIGTQTIVSGEADVSGQPSGQDITARLKTPGGSPKLLAVQDLELQWSS